MDSDLIDLQIKLAHQEQVIHELSHVVYTQQKDIDRLARELRALKEQMLMGADQKQTDNVPPPHY